MLHNQIEKRPVKTYHVFYRLTEGKLELVLFEGEHFKKVGGMASFTLDQKGFKLAWEGEAPSTLVAISKAEIAIEVTQPLISEHLL